MIEVCPETFRQSKQMRAASASLLLALNIQSGAQWPCAHFRTPETTHTIAGVAVCKACRRTRLKRTIRRIAARLEINRATRARLQAHNDRLHEEVRKYERRLPIDLLLASVAQTFGVSVADIRGKSRQAIHVDARSVLTTILRDRGVSYPVIGRLLGGRDHSCAINSARNFAYYARRNPLVMDAYIAHADKLGEAA